MNNTEINTLWEDVCSEIKKEVDEQTFDVWISPISLKEKTNDTIVLEVPNNFFGSWIRENYQSLITKIFENILKTNISIKYDIKIKEDNIKTPQEKLKDEVISVNNEATHNNHFVSTEQKPIWLDNTYTFDNFVVGSANQFSHAAAIAISNEPAKVYNPLFIHGPTGLGKTHLLKAIAYKIHQNFPNKKILFMPSEKFTNMMIYAIKDRTTQEFRKKFREADILLIDDIHFIAGKDATQEEFFHTFNELYDSQKQIVLTSDRPPKDIPKLEARLISRFEWGLITDIKPPDFETRVAILKKKMEKETIIVPDDVAYFIANNIKSNIRELEGALCRVVAYASLINKAINLDLVKEILQDSFYEEDHKININIIQQKTANYFNIQLSDMRSKKRTRNLAYPRQVAMYLVRYLTNLSLPEIGEFFGGRDHTTVMYGISKIEKEIQKNIQVKNMIDELINIIKCR